MITWEDDRGVSHGARPDVVATARCLAVVCLAGLLIGAASCGAPKRAEIFDEQRLRPGPVTFNSDVPMEVWIRPADDTWQAERWIPPSWNYNARETIAETPSPEPIEIPADQTWGVTVFGDDITAAVGEIRKHGISRVYVEVATDEDVLLLRGLDQVKELAFAEEVELTDKGLAVLEDMPHLRELAIGDFFDDEDDESLPLSLASLGALRELKELRLSGVSLTEDSLTHLKGLSNLKWLSLAGVSIAGRGLLHLQDLQQLERLTVDSLCYEFVWVEPSSPEEEGHWEYLYPALAEFGEMPNLEELELSRPSDEDLALLPAFPNLQKLILSAYGITDVGMRDLGQMNQLKSLRMEMVWAITDKGLAELTKLADLEALYLSVGPGLGPGYDPTEEAVAGLLRGLPQLRTLYLSTFGISGITDVSLAVLAEANDYKLERVFLAGGWNVTDEGLAHLKGLSNLKYLYLYYAANTTREGVAELKEAIPGLQVHGGGYRRR